MTNNASQGDAVARGIEAILAKDDTAVMIDELRELFGADIDVDSRFTTAQVITAMERSFEHGKAHIEMLRRAEAAALKAQSLSEWRDSPDVRQALLEACLALETIARRVFNDNGDHTIDTSPLDPDVYSACYYASRAVKAALSALPEAPK